MTPAWPSNEFEAFYQYWSETQNGRGRKLRKANDIKIVSINCLPAPHRSPILDKCDCFNSQGLCHMSSTVYYGKGSQTGYRFKDFAVDSPKKIETFVEGRATNQETSDSLILNHNLWFISYVAHFTAAKQLVTIDGSNDTSNITSSSMGISNQNKLSPELRKMLDFTTPYKVLVNKKSWNQHNSKNNVNAVEKLPEKQNEAPTSARKVLKEYINFLKWTSW